MAGWLGWLEHQPLHQKGFGFDLRLGHVREAANNVSLIDVFFSFFLSLKTNKQKKTMSYDPLQKSHPLEKNEEHFPRALPSV